MRICFLSLLISIAVSLATTAPSASNDENPYLAAESGEWFCARVGAFSKERERYGQCNPVSRSRFDPQQPGAPFRYQSEGKRPTCGAGSHFIDRWFQNDGGVFLEVRGQRYLPLRISRSTEDKCPRVKITPACAQLGADVTVLEGEEEYSSVELSVFEAPSWIRGYSPQDQRRIFEMSHNNDTLLISPRGEVQYVGEDLGIFYLVKSPYLFMDEIEKTTREFRCKAGESYADCERNLIYEVDRLLDMELRAHISARAKASKEQRDADLKSIVDELGQLSAFQMLLHDKTVANELGSHSPFSLVDAIYGNSGPSFSIEQRDIATNDEARALFAAVFATGESFTGIPKKHSDVYLKRMCLAVPFRYQGLQERIFYNLYDKNMSDVLREKVKEIVSLYKVFLQNGERVYRENYQGKLLDAGSADIAVFMVHLTHWFGIAEAKVREAVFGKDVKVWEKREAACAIYRWLLHTGEGTSHPQRVQRRFFNTVALSQSEREYVEKCR